MEFFENLKTMLVIVAWAMKNLDLVLGGLSIAAIFMSPSTAGEKVIFAITAIVCIAVRVIRVIRRKRFLENQTGQY